MKKITFSIIVGLLGIFSLVFPAHGASSDTIRVYFSASTSTSTVGEEVSIKVLIDTALPVNAYTFAVSFSSDNLGFITSDNSRSLIDVWQTTPLLSVSGISFKGGSLTPFHGERGELLTFLFRALHEGDATFVLHDTAIYLANGKGTKVIPQLDNLTVHIIPAGTVALQNIPPGYLDYVPPKIKYLAFIANPYDTQAKLLGFQVADPGSGIKQVFLRTRQFFWWSDFAQAINPTALQSDIWTAELRVIDNAGNVSDAAIYDWNAFTRGPLLWGGALLILFSLGAYVIRRRLK